MANRFTFLPGRSVGVRIGLVLAILLALVGLCWVLDTMWPGIVFGVVAVARLIAIVRQQRARPATGHAPSADQLPR